MKQINEDKQITDVWQLPAIARWEKIMRKTSHTGYIDTINNRTGIAIISDSGAL
ncbi:hypothetical protein [Phocaeicola salanitronis]|jgi:hypothetical protein|uniref:hypothetical protein n=1 Tax=Phocaeicola salanitronis TaxID=376805 RepID=UPI003F4EED50